MSKIEDGGAAFPMLGNVGFSSDWQVDHGMSLRDHYAGQAMQGLLAGTLADGTVKQIAEYAPTLAQTSFAIADAMLKARAAAVVAVVAAAGIIAQAAHLLMVLA